MAEKENDMEKDGKNSLEKIEKLLNKISQDPKQIKITIKELEKISNLTQEEGDFLIKKMSQEKKEDMLQIMSMQYPDMFIRGNTKLQNMIFSEKVSNFINSCQPLYVDDDETTVDAELGADVYLDEEGRSKISKIGVLADNPCFCGNVLQAVISLIANTSGYKKGDPLIFTDPPFIDTTSIYKMLTDKHKSKVPERIKDLIDEVLEMFGSTYIYCDWTNQAVKWKLPEDQGTYVRKETMMHIVKNSIVKNGKKIDGYYIIKVPFLMEYAYASGQIFQIELKNIPSINRADEYKININMYLQSEIAIAKNAGKTYIDRLYTTIFSKCSIKTTNKNMLKRYKDFIISELLSTMKASGQVKDFQEMAAQQEPKVRRGKLRIFL